jgi:D-3-phosphoglycerate dehydrogenase
MINKVLSTEKMISDCPEGIRLLEKHLCHLDIDDLSFKENSYETILKIGPKYDAIIAGRANWDRKFFETVFKKLKVLAICGAGYDYVDLNAATDFGIPITNAPGMNSFAVAELTVAFILELNKQLKSIDREIKLGIWNQSILLNEIMGKTIGIIGLGNVGKEVVKRISAFSVRIFANDIKKDINFSEQFSITYVDLETLLKKSDYVSIHCSLNDKTRHMLTWEKLQWMKPTAYLINTSRGGLIDEQALIEALKSNFLAGAALDVFEKEPVQKENPLLKMENVITTPHIAYRTLEANNRVAFSAVQSVIDVLTGRKPKNLLNPLYKKNIKNDMRLI